MNWAGFFKDRAVAYVIFVVTLTIINLVLSAFQINFRALIIISVLSVLGLTAHEGWVFLRRKNFYDRMVQSVKLIDQKYLLAEMLPKPEFYEGTIVYDALCEAENSMAEAVAKYQRKSDEYRDYIELWAHEVKIPLAGLVLTAHNNPEIGEKINDQLRRIGSNIDNVLYYARSENAEKDYLIGEVSLRQAFREVAMQNREVLQMRNVSIHTEGLDVTVLTDSKWLSFILSQLLDNSLKYFSKERDPEITVTAEEDAQGVKLHFRDNGIGIAESDLPYIFEKSFTGSNGRSGTKSTGIGLYIVKNLCRHLGHTIEVKSKEGEYTEFIITFFRNDLCKPE